MANYKPLACHYASFGENMPPVSNVTQDIGCKRTEKKNSKPLTKFPGSKFSFRLNLDEKL